jgi:hypothetical protein
MARWLLTLPYFVGPKHMGQAKYIYWGLDIALDSVLVKYTVTLLLVLFLCEILTICRGAPD